MSRARVPSLLESIVFALVVMCASVAVAQSRGSSPGRPGNNAQANLTVTITVVPSVSATFDSNHNARVSVANTADPGPNITAEQGVGNGGRGRVEGDVRVAMLTSGSSSEGITYELAPPSENTSRIEEVRPLYKTNAGRRVQSGVLRTVTVVVK